MNDTAHAAFDDARYTSILDAQVEELLQRVRLDCEKRCRALRDEAESQAREILRCARKEARANVHQAVSQERARVEHSRRQSQASAAMQERLRIEQSAQRLLVGMWKALPGRLEARWHDCNQRRAWIRAAALQACTVLGARNWRVEHGADASAAECREIIEHSCERLAHRAPAAIECSLDSQITAGIRIRTANASLDATIAGLLANRETVEASFLAEYSALSSVPPAEHMANE